MVSQCSTLFPRRRRKKNEEENKTKKAWKFWASPSLPGSYSHCPSSRGMSSLGVPEKPSLRGFRPRKSDRPRPPTSSKRRSQGGDPNRARELEKEISIWLWVKNVYPTWNPGKWKHGPKPAVLWWFNCDPYPYPGLCRKRMDPPISWPEAENLSAKHSGKTRRRGGLLPKC